MTPPWAVLSPNRAAGKKLISTELEPLMMVSGGPTQTAMSLIRAAGIKPIKQFGDPEMIGPPTCGTGPGLTMGQVCISVILAAGGISYLDISDGVTVKMVRFLRRIEVSDKDLSCKYCIRPSGRRFRPI